MWTRKLLKENGKTAFKRNYWPCVAVSFILTLLVGGGAGVTFRQNWNTDFNYNDSISQGMGGYYNAQIVKYVALFLPVIIIACLIGLAIGIAVSAFLINVIELGGNRYFLENREHKTKVSQVLFGFSNGNYMNCVKILFLRDLYLVGWMLLFIIPGIVKAYEYRMISYILAENPRISKERAFEISRQMMDGHKWEAFVLDLSFLGWQILSGCTMGIVGFFYVNPYMFATYAEFYTAVKSEAMQRGATNSIELPGVGYPEFTEQF